MPSACRTSSTPSPPSAATCAAATCPTGLVFDAVRVRLIEIGEAVTAIPDDVLASGPTLPSGALARMRDRLAHHYFDTLHSHVTGTVNHDLEPLEAAVRRLQNRTPPAR